MTTLDPISFDTHPDRYRHWRLAIDGERATLTMAVDPKGGLREGYELKLNSYDLGVDIELDDALLQLRVNHLTVGVVVVRTEGSVSYTHLTLPTILLV